VLRVSATWLWTALGTLAATLIGAALLVVRLLRSQRRLRAANARLRQSESDLRALNAMLEQRAQAPIAQQGAVDSAKIPSERKAPEAECEGALSEARQAARERGEFLDQMSHELRTPLNAIMGFAQILQRDSTLTEQQMRALKIIDDSGRHLLTLIDDVLDLARLDAAKLELHPVDIGLQFFLDQICDAIRIEAEEKSLHLTLEAAFDLPAKVRADEKRLRQILLNLLSNAVTFTDRGAITLRVMRRPSSDPAMARLRFEVADQGIGMSDEEMLRLFRPFEQIAEAKPREERAGLGLAISRRLVRLMGGDIDVRSRLGEGSVFAFEVEVDQPESRVQDRALLRD